MYLYYSHVEGVTQKGSLLPASSIILNIYIYITDNGDNNNNNYDTNNNKLISCINFYLHSFYFSIFFFLLKNKFLSAVWSALGHYLRRRYEIGSKRLILSKCVFYRPKHRTNGVPLKLTFEGLRIQRWNKSTDSAQRVDEKNVFICLVFMFTSKAMAIKMSNDGSFSYFLLTIVKN